MSIRGRLVREIIELEGIPRSGRTASSDVVHDAEADQETNNETENFRGRFWQLHGLIIPCVWGMKILGAVSSPSDAWQFTGNSTLKYRHNRVLKRPLDLCSAE